MKKIIAAGHVCVDITPMFPRKNVFQNLSEILIPGQLIQMDGVSIHTGGSVANTGLALKKLGCDCLLLGKIGEDALGQMITEIFSQYGGRGLIADPKTATSYTVVIAVPGIDRLFLHDPGANDTFVSADIPDSVWEEAVLFHFGYPPLMKSMYENGGEELIKIFRRAKSHGLATSLDLAAVDPRSPAGEADWRRILEGVLPYVDFFVPSFEELCLMLDPVRYARLTGRGGDITEGLAVMEEAGPLSEKILKMGARVALIKCGTSGMLYHTAGRRELGLVGPKLPLDPKGWEDRYGVQKCFKAEVVKNTTGAGDVSIAAFLAAVLEGRSVEECAALAAAEGAWCVTTYDALSGIKPLEELEEWIHSQAETASDS